VEVTEAVSGYVLAMEERAVALVLFKYIERIPLCDTDHIAVAGDFCHDGGKRNDRLGLVASDDGLLMDIHGWRMEKTVEADFRFIRRTR